MVKPTLKPLDREDIEKIVSDALDKAVAFVEAEVAEPRIKAEKYFQGQTDLEHETGRSASISTKCRDVVRAVKPSLMRVFLYTDKPVQYVPRTPADAPMAEQATAYMHWKFSDMGGYRILMDVCQDALVKKTGFTKCYWDDQKKVTIHNFADLDDATLAMVLEDDEVEVIEHTSKPDPDAQPQPQIDPETGQPVMGPDGQPVMGEQPMLHDVKVSRTTINGDLKVVAIPPEEIVVNKEARSGTDFYFLAHRSDQRVGDLIAMGYSLDDLEGATALPETAMDSEEKEQRTGGMQIQPRDDENEAIDATTKLVGVTEAYMSLDVDGIGTPVMHRFFLVGGTKPKLLDWEPVEECPIAVFEIDPEPHTFFGRSLVDIVMEDQDTATSILRGIIDNVHMVNNPRTAILDGYVTVDDLLNGEIGGVVREQQPGAIRDLTVPFVAGQTLGALQYIDTQVEVKSGVTRASMGLDPDAMQSTNKMAVQANIQAAAGQVEVMAKNLAEGGLKQLFGQMLRLYVKHVKREVAMSLSDGNWQPVDPRTWKADMHVRATVGLGTGREEERAMTLDAILARQEVILQTQQASGVPPGAELVTLQNYRNALVDRARLGGVLSADRYFQPMDAQKEQALAQAAAAAAQQPQQPDPTQALVEAENIKAQVKMQSDVQNAALQQQKMALEDDRERDKMTQDLGVQIAKIFAQYGISVDTASIKAEQAAARPMNGPGGAGAPPGPPAGGAPPTAPPAGMVQ